ncbi:hypothetical protein [uncultured Fibrobacter sp.]|nr:hypothetical protein [uncultured Fibrobacter sp.]
MRYHKSADNKHWINYLTGVAIITDMADNIRIIPVTAFDSGFLQ